MYERVHQLHLDETVPLYAMFGQIESEHRTLKLDGYKFTKICGKEEQKGGNVFKTAMNKAFVRTNEDKGIKRGNAKKVNL